MAKWKHRIVEKNEEALTGVCVHCGPVKLYYRKTLDRYVCAVGKAEQRGSSWKDNFRDGATRPSQIEIDKMIFEQENKCLICREEMAEPHVDHCHNTGRVRGILCRGCNLGLGFFRDNKDYLTRAAEYL